MCESKNQTQGGVFDLGTSPHGLSAELQRTHQETGSTVGLRSLEDGLGVAASVSHAERSEHGAQAANPESETFQKLGGHTFTFTEEQRIAVAFALLNEITYLEECDEFPHPEILESIHYLSGAREILEGREPL